MSLAFPFLRPLRSAVPTALIALSLAVGARPSPAQTVIQAARPIGLTHAKSKPYNFTGRIFDLSDTGGVASGTLLRRHTVLTAGHVVFSPTGGFIVNGTFTRGLYETSSISKDQIISAQSLAGYQAAITAAPTGTFPLNVVEVDLGLVLVPLAPIDADWGNYLVTPSLLADPSVPTFILGYPGQTFDARTMTYIVPATPFVGAGSTTSSAIYENDEVAFEEGNSGGPIYVVPDGVHQSVQAVVSSGANDPTGTFNRSFVRAIDKSASRFLADAEYTAGLIKRVKVTGPTTVSRGQTYTYTTTIVFSQPSRDGTVLKPTTDRYSELKLVSSTPGTATQPLVTVVKTSNTTFRVTFSSNVRAGTLTTLQVNYDGTATPNGKSSLLIKVQ